MRSVHPDRPQLTRRDFTADMASERSPISTATDPHLLNKLSTMTPAFFARSGGFSGVTGFNQPHLTVEHGKESHHEPDRTSNAFGSIWYRH
jgi:hypothetical protein